MREALAGKLLDGRSHRRRCVCSDDATNSAVRQPPPTSPLVPDRCSAASARASAALLPSASSFSRNEGTWASCSFEPPTISWHSSLSVPRCGCVSGKSIARLSVAIIFRNSLSLATSEIPVKRPPKRAGEQKKALRSRACSLGRRLQRAAREAAERKRFTGMEPKPFRSYSLERPNEFRVCSSMLNPSIGCV